MNITQRLQDVAQAVDDLYSDPADAAADYRRFMATLQEETPPAAEPSPPGGGAPVAPPTGIPRRHLWSAALREQDGRSADWQEPSQPGPESGHLPWRQAPVYTSVFEASDVSTVVVASCASVALRSSTACDLYPPGLQFLLLHDEDDNNARHYDRMDALERCLAAVAMFGGLL
ncbi:hypothetical protein [Streptomyces melanogenes]|uniref:hypothetical protein n=1 Tax=Streptomyces melanogenes TaxID=67326 RepID=UPI0037A95501